MQNFIRLIDNILFMNREAERLGRLKPEEKVAIAIGMTDFCVRVCEAGISEEELLAKLRAVGMVEAAS